MTKECTHSSVLISAKRKLPGPQLPVVSLISVPQMVTFHKVQKVTVSAEHSHGSAVRRLLVWFGFFFHSFASDQFSLQRKTASFSLPSLFGK